MANDRIKISALREATGDPGLGYDVVDTGDSACATPRPVLGQEGAQDEMERQMQEQTAQLDAARKASLAAQRQRDEDAALADADEIVRRMRARLGRKVCSPADGRIIREIWERLKAMPGAEITSDDDPSFRT